MLRTFAVVFGVLALIVALSAAAIEYLPATLYFPIVRLHSGGELDVTFLGAGFANSEACATKSDELAKPLKASRAGIITAACARGLDDESRKLLSRAALDVPTVRMQNGVVIVFQSREPRLSLAACLQSEAASRSFGVERRLKCIPAGNPR
ncbi:hypothetical protein [Georgfuchsia toluolica]|uniref:hypothetical protein n=1 Tax=Georgfuchsia toluolica TaxID=424218 RepID=UPI001C73B3AF|nr:hypothetical protein [Georgfuchsia toluolica]